MDFANVVNHRRQFTDFRIVAARKLIQTLQTLLGHARLPPQATVDLKHSLDPEPYLPGKTFTVQTDMPGVSLSGKPLVRPFSSAYPAVVSHSYPDEELRFSAAASLLVRDSAE